MPPSVQVVLAQWYTQSRVHFHTDVTDCSTLAAFTLCDYMCSTLGFLADCLWAEIRFKVQDDDIGKDDLAAWACIRLDRLQEGYRFLHFLDAKGAESNGALLVKITKYII